MQAKYSQYDSDSFLQGYTTPIGGLNANAEFRPQAEESTLVRSCPECIAWLRSTIWTAP